MDMKALAQGSAGVVDSLVALRAGVDLLLLTPDRAAQRRLEAGLRQAALRGLVPAAGHPTPRASGSCACAAGWRGFEPPGRDVVRSEAHRALARRAAAAALTLVRDEAGLLPLRPAPGDRIVVITPQPRDLTPADSSADEPLALGEALRRHHADVVDLRVDAEPDARQIAGAREAVQGAAYAVVATLAADVQPAQARLVEAVLSTGVPTVTRGHAHALRPGCLPRLPGRISAAMPSCRPASGAVADALFGRQPIRGRLPVAIPGLYARGHGMEVERWA